MKSITCILVATLLASCTALPRPKPYPYPSPAGGHSTQPSYSESRLYPENSGNKGSQAEKIRPNNAQESSLKPAPESDSTLAQETAGVTYYTYPSYPSYPTYTYVTPVPPTTGPYYYPNYPGYVVY